MTTITVPLSLAAIFDTSTFPPGPAGPAGAIGPVGATGAAGPIGPQGPVGSVSSILQQFILDWDSNTPVVAGTSVILLASQWASATVLSATCSCAGGSFTANIEKNGAAITGLGALAVGSTVTTTAATANNTLVKGDSLKLVITVVTGTPETATIQLNLQTSVS